MRILANENLPGPVLRSLRARGHDVMAVKEVMRGADDRAILDRARAENRLLLTLDKDFGELAFHSGLPPACGVVLFRLSGDSPEVDNARALAALESGLEWTGHFAVVTNRRIRLRPLLGGPKQPP